MAHLRDMPAIVIPPAALRPFGAKWKAGGGDLTEKKSQMDLGLVFDARVADALATMLGGISVVKPNANALMPEAPDVVELGACRIVGGVRPQNFDVGYRPDGVRFAFDGKTLNNAKSVQKNYQNMINDLATEATTVHTRFPYAVVAFLVAIPRPCLASPQKEALTDTLERLSQRASPLDSVHKAEAIALALWDPETGEIDTEWPLPGSCLRIGEFPAQVQASYLARYKGLPPHD